MDPSHRMLPAALFAAGVLGAILADRAFVSPPLVVFGLLALGLLVGSVAAWRPLTGRFALACTALGPIGFLLAPVFC